MPSIGLVPRSPLDGVVKPGRYGAEGDAAGVIIAPRSDLASIQVMCRKNRVQELCHLVKTSLNIVLPLAPRRSVHGSTHFVWAGPDRWLAATPDQLPHIFERDMRERLSSAASITNQSDSRSIVRVGGPKARETLAKGLPIDLDPRAFGPNDVAMSMVGHINVHLWQCEPTPSYELAVFRSFAASLCEWLIDAAAEFGAQVADLGGDSPT